MQRVICVCSGVDVFVFEAHLRDKGPAGGCEPAGCLQATAAPRPAPPPRTGRTGTQTEPAPGSCGAEHAVVNTRLQTRIF